MPCHDYAACLTVCINRYQACLWCRKLRPSLELPKEVCHSIQDIRLLGQGKTRTAWLSNVTGPACLKAPGLCGKTLVHKRVNTKQTSSFVAQATNGNWREAYLLNALQCEYGESASLGFFGLCNSGISMVTEMLQPVTADLRATHEGCLQLRLHAQRMANFSAGPLTLLDYAWPKQFGQASNGHVHFLDLAYASVLPHAASSQRRGHFQSLLRKLKFNASLCASTRVLAEPRPTVLRASRPAHQHRHQR